MIFSAARQHSGIGHGLVVYGTISAAALIVDLVLLDRFLAIGLNAALAAAAAYGAGVAVHWVLSARTVFARGAGDRGSSRRRRQKLLFSASALVGLGITTVIVGLGASLDWDVRVAKLLAIGISFAAVWVLRRLYIFAD